MKQYTHESEELNAILGKKVKVTLFDDTTITGVLTRAEWKPDRYGVANYAFRKTHVKKIEIIKKDYDRLTQKTNNGDYKLKNLDLNFNDVQRLGLVEDQIENGTLGNTKQAVREFADFLKEYAIACRSSGYDGISEEDIENKLKEFLEE